MTAALKAGTRLRSTVDSCEIVVVKAPKDPIDLRCGGHPFVAVTDDAPSTSIERGFDAGTELGKRYSSDELGVEVLVTRAGQGSISVGENVLESKGAKALPASD